MEKKIYTVKDEEADCNRCDNCDDDSAFYCIKQCGEENNWKGYERTSYEYRMNNNWRKIR